MCPVIGSEARAVLVSTTGGDRLQELYRLRKKYTYENIRHTSRRANWRTRKYDHWPNNTPTGPFGTNQHSKVFEMIAVFPRNRKRNLHGLPESPIAGPAATYQSEAATTLQQEQG